MINKPEKGTGEGGREGSVDFSSSLAIFTCLYFYKKKKKKADEDR